jgi:hypothetical protein
MTAGWPTAKSDSTVNVPLLLSVHPSDDSVLSAILKLRDAITFSRTSRLISNDQIADQLTSVADTVATTGLDRLVSDVSKGRKRGRYHSLPFSPKSLEITTNQKVGSSTLSGRAILTYFRTNEDRHSLIGL